MQPFIEDHPDKLAALELDPAALMFCLLAVLAGSHLKGYPERLIAGNPEYLIRNNLTDFAWMRPFHLLDDLFPDSTAG